MVLNRINLLIAGGNEGGEQGRQVPLEEEGELGAGTATAAWLCLWDCTFSWLGLIFFNFLVLLETGNKATAPWLDCVPQFQAGI